MKPVQKYDGERQDLGELGEPTDEDLREFMVADTLPFEAQQGFRSALQKKLWALVERIARDSAAREACPNASSRTHETTRTP